MVQNRRKVPVKEGGGVQDAAPQLRVYSSSLDLCSVNSCKLPWSSAVLKLLGDFALLALQQHHACSVLCSSSSVQHGELLVLLYAQDGVKPGPAVLAAMVAMTSTGLALAPMTMPPMARSVLPNSTWQLQPWPEPTAYHLFFCCVMIKNHYGTPAPNMKHSPADMQQEPLADRVPTRPRCAPLQHHTCFANLATRPSHAGLMRWRMTPTCPLLRRGAGTWSVAASCCARRECPLHIQHTGIVHGARRQTLSSTSTRGVCGPCLPIPSSAPAQLSTRAWKSAYEAGRLRTHSQHRDVPT